MPATQKKASSKLGKRERRLLLFAAALLADPEQNATLAAQLVGISPRNPGAAAVWASRAKKEPLVISLIEKRTKEIHGKLEVTQERVRQELARVGFFDIRKLLNADGTAKAISELDDDTAAAIAGIEVLEIDGETIIGRVKKYRIANKVSALELLGKEQKMFTDRHEHAGPDGKPIQLLVADMTDEQLAERERELLQELGVNASIATRRTGTGSARAENTQ